MPPRKKKEVEVKEKTRLTKEEADSLLKDVNHHLMCHAELRFGQALWNMLQEKYPSIANKFHGTHRDFFYWTKAGDIMSTFMEHYVEQ